MFVITILHLLCCIISIVKVSYSEQIAVPAGTYQIYRQTPYNNAPQAASVLIHPTNNNNHYFQANTAQNIIPNDLAKVVISKILSSPTVHKYMDPSIRYCRQSDVEVPKRGCSKKPTPHVTNNYFIVPPEYLKLNNSEVALEKIVPELFKRVENEVVVTPAELKRYNEDKNIQSETPVKPNKDASTNKTCNDAQNVTKKRNRRRKKRPRKRRKNKLILTECDNKTENDINRPNSETQEKKAKEIVSTSTGALHEDNLNTTNSSQTNKTRKRTRKRKKNNDETKISSKELSLNTDTFAENELIEDTQKSIEKNDTKLETEKKPEYLHTLKIVSNKNPISFDDVAKFQLSRSENDDSRVTRNFKDDSILQDFKQKFPEVPENLVRSMLSYVQNQFQNNLGTNFFYPGGFPFAFEQFFQLPQSPNYCSSYAKKRKNKGKHRRRKQKHRKGSSRRRKNRKHKSKVSKNAELKNELSTNTVGFEDITEKNVTETNSLLEVKEPPDSSQILSVEISDLLYTPIEKETETLDTELTLEEIDMNYNIDDPYTSDIHEEDDLVPTVYDNKLTDDYYPIFTEDAGGFNTDENFVKNLNNRYYYTTDKNKDNVFYEPYIYEEIKKPRRNFKDDIPKLLKYNYKDHNLKHTYFDADREGFRNLARELPKQLPRLKPKTEVSKTGYTDEADFKSPPALEFPDFVTRKVEKPSKLREYSYGDSDEINKYDVLVDDLPTSLNTELFSNALKENGRYKGTKSQAKPKDIETVYANSKVAKYGADRKHDNLADDQFFNENNDLSNNKHISYVIAKSLANPDIL